MEKWARTEANQKPLRNESWFELLLRLSAVNSRRRLLAKQLFFREKARRVGLSFDRTGWIDETSCGCNCAGRGSRPRRRFWFCWRICRKSRGRLVRAAVRCACKAGSTPSDFKGGADAGLPSPWKSSKGPVVRLWGRMER